MTPNSQPYFPALTGLRAVAAWLVFIHHFPAPFLNTDWGRSFSTEAHIGVSIFFTLSGFLIANRYAFKGKVNLKSYFINRFAKVYPLYFALTTLTFLRLNAGDMKLYLYNISFLRGFFDDLKFTGIAQGWTLTVEECFYILAPLIFLAVHKGKIWLIIWPVILLIIGLLITQLPLIFRPQGLMSSASLIFNFTIFGRLFEFMAGVGLAWIWEFRKDKPTPSFKNYTYLGLILFISTYALITTFQSEVYGFGQEHPMGRYIHNILLPISTSILLYGLISETTFLGRILSSKPMWWFGSASYAFYLIHMGIFHDAIVTFISWNWWVRFIFLNILALLAFITFEYPVQQLIKNYNKEQSVIQNLKNAFKSTICLLKT